MRDRMEELNPKSPSARTRIVVEVNRNGHELLDEADLATLRDCVIDRDSDANIVCVCAIDGSPLQCANSGTDYPVSISYIVDDLPYRRQLQTIMDVHSVGEKGSAPTSEQLSPARGLCGKYQELQRFNYSPAYCSIYLRRAPDFLLCKAEQALVLSVHIKQKPSVAPAGVKFVGKRGADSNLERHNKKNRKWANLDTIIIHSCNFILWCFILHVLRAYHLHLRHSFSEVPLAKRQPSRDI
jgi:hypothetical protein